VKTSHKGLVVAGIAGVVVLGIWWWSKRKNESEASGQTTYPVGEAVESSQAVQAENEARAEKAAERQEAANERTAERAEGRESREALYANDAAENKLAAEESREARNQALTEKREGYENEARKEEQPATVEANSLRSKLSAQEAHAKKEHERILKTEKAHKAASKAGTPKHQPAAKHAHTPAHQKRREAKRAPAKAKAHATTKHAAPKPAVKHTVTADHRSTAATHQAPQHNVPVHHPAPKKKKK
jgi:hypothetical protein